jgi:uncharacterized protein (TIGR03000 family)
MSLPVRIAAVVPFFSALALLLAGRPTQAGGPVFGNGGFALEFFAPSYYGYYLDDPNPGYYGGGRYREYYSYGRGYGLANYPGPVPGPMYRSVPSSVLPPKWLPPTYPPPSPPEHSVAVPSTSGAVAYLLVQTPADAEVWLEGVKTQQSGPARLFATPPLTPNARYAYAVRVRWSEDGRPMEQTQEVILQAGDRLSLQFPTGPKLDLLPTPKQVEE